MTSTCSSIPSPDKPGQHPRASTRQHRAVSLALSYPGHTPATSSSSSGSAAQLLMPVLLGMDELSQSGFSSAYHSEGSMCRSVLAGELSLLGVDGSASSTCRAMQWHKTGLQHPTLLQRQPMLVVHKQQLSAACPLGLPATTQPSTCARLHLSRPRIPTFTVSRCLWAVITVKGLTPLELCLPEATGLEGCCSALEV